MEKKYHINVSKEDLEGARHLIICGDPGRVPKISSFLKDPRELSFHREYRVHLGYLKGDRPIIVSSCGIGCPSTAIGIEEFGMLGIDTIIRVGTSGIISKKVKLGDIVSATGSIRDEGTSRQYVDEIFPAVASPDVVMAIRKAVDKLGLKSRFHEGIIHSKDAFYSETPKMIPNDRETEERWRMWERAGALVSEMEASTLFVISQIRGWRAGGIMAAIGLMESGELIIEKSKGKLEAIKVGVEAMNYL